MESEKEQKNAASACHRVWLGLGGNIGAVEESFRYALRRLTEESAERSGGQTADSAAAEQEEGDLPTGGGRLRAASSLYRTAAWGQTQQPDFLNACVEIETRLPPQALLRLCLQIEKERKRQRLEKWGPRSLDIDILIYENYQSAAAGGRKGADSPAKAAGAAEIEGRRQSDNHLILPHPFIRERAFVLIPLAEIAPQLQLGGKTIGARAAAMQAAGQVGGIAKIALPNIWLKP